MGSSCILRLCAKVQVWYVIAPTKNSSRHSSTSTNPGQEGSSLNHHVRSLMLVAVCYSFELICQSPSSCISATHVVLRTPYPLVGEV